MKRFLLLALMGIVAITTGCCGLKKCSKGTCKADTCSTEKENEKSTEEPLLIYRDKLDVRESGPMQSGIEFADEDLK